MNKIDRRSITAFLPHKQMSVLFLLQHSEMQLYQRTGIDQNRYSSLQCLSGIKIFSEEITIQNRIWTTVTHRSLSLAFLFYKLLHQNTATLVHIRFYLRLLSHYKGRVEQLKQRLQNLKYLLPGLFQKKFVVFGPELVGSILMHTPIIPAPTDSTRIQEFEALNCNEAPLNERSLWGVSLR